MENLYQRAINIFNDHLKDDILQVGITPEDVGKVVGIVDYIDGKPVFGPVQDTSKDGRLPDPETEDIGKVLSVVEGEDGPEYQPAEAGGSGLPDPAELADGTAMVAVDGEWVMQDGYAYSEKEVLIKPKEVTVGGSGIYLNLEEAFSFPPSTVANYKAVFDGVEYEFECSDVSGGSGEAFMIKRKGSQAWETDPCAFQIYSSDQTHAQLQGAEAGDHTVALSINNAVPFNPNYIPNVSPIVTFDATEDTDGTIECDATYSEITEIIKSGKIPIMKVIPENGYNATRFANLIYSDGYGIDFGYSIANSGASTSFVVCTYHLNTSNQWSAVKYDSSSDS